MNTNNDNSYQTFETNRTQDNQQNVSGQPQMMNAPTQQPPPPQMGIPFNNNYPPQENYNNNYNPFPPPMGVQPQFQNTQPTVQYSQPAYLQGQPVSYLQQPVPQGYPVTSNNMLQYPMMTNLNSCGHPAAFRCPSCQKEGVTMVTTEVGSGTFLMCCVLCCFGGIFGLLPFCMPDCQDKKHFCPQCGAQVGLKEYKPC